MENMNKINVIRAILGILIVIQLMILFTLSFLGLTTHLDWKMLVMLAIEVILLLPFEEFEIAKLIKGNIRRF